MSLNALTASSSDWVRTSSVASGPSQGAPPAASDFSILAARCLPRRTRNGADVFSTLFGAAYPEAHRPALGDYVCAHGVPQGQLCGRCHDNYAASYEDDETEEGKDWLSPLDSKRTATTHAMAVSPNGGGRSCLLLHFPRDISLARERPHVGLGDSVYTFQRFNITLR
ncbi:hypothetical protein DFJ74DRAFT_660907 [Hyaloraphidium curvatum]|nr:hypothetical protein DFJ74DRAFT_660907 [Hyaloraphidium curvatum]